MAPTRKQLDRHDDDDPRSYGGSHGSHGSHGDYGKHSSRRKSWLMEIFD
jgi:uncharacterized protein